MFAALILVGTLNQVKSQSLSSSQPQYEHKNPFDIEPIVINFSDGPGNAKDWIGIYDGDRLPGNEEALIWSYVDGTKSGNTGKKSGSIEFSVFLTPGTYKAYLIEDNG